MLLTEPLVLVLLFLSVAPSHTHTQSKRITFPLGPSGLFRRLLSLSLFLPVPCESPNSLPLYWRPHLLIHCRASPGLDHLPGDANWHIFTLRGDAAGRPVRRSLCPTVRSPRSSSKPASNQRRNRTTWFSPSFPSGTVRWGKKSTGNPGNRRGRARKGAELSLHIRGENLESFRHCPPALSSRTEKEKKKDASQTNTHTHREGHTACAFLTAWVRRT